MFFLPGNPGEVGAREVGLMSVVAVGVKRGYIGSQHSLSGDSLASAKCRNRFSQGGERTPTPNAVKSRVENKSMETVDSIFLLLF